MTDDRPAETAQEPRSAESPAVPAISVDDFVANAADLMRRVRDGEAFAITAEGEAFALVRPQSAVERRMGEFVAKGYADPDWPHRHEELLEMVPEGPLPALFEPGWSASEELIRGREEDQR